MDVDRDFELADRFEEQETTSTDSSDSEQLEEPPLYNRKQLH